MALLLIFSKILEKAIFNQIITYLESNNLLHPSHHGFRSCHNTGTAILQMFDTWTQALENSEISAVIMLDMSAAFDVVDPVILSNKLKHYGFENCSTDWITSYMTNRKQKVYVDGHLSEALSLEVGVPQGSILGPLLYILYTNDLPEVIHENHEPKSGFFNTYCKDCGGSVCFSDLKFEITWQTIN